MQSLECDRPEIASTMEDALDPDVLVRNPEQDEVVSVHSHANTCCQFIPRRKSDRPPCDFLTYLLNFGDEGDGS